MIIVKLRSAGTQKRLSEIGLALVFIAACSLSVLSCGASNASGAGGKAGRVSSSGSATLTPAEAVLKAEAEAKAKAEAEAKELEAILGKPVVAEVVAVAPAPVIQAAPVAAVVPVAAAPVVSAVQTRKVQKVEYTDRMLVPIHVGGAVLRPIDEAAVKKALLAGASIPGASLVDVETYAMARA